MEFTGTLDEVVVFELPTRLWGESLMTFLAPGRLTWLQEGDASCVVGALLNPDVEDIAALLRSVQVWLDRSGLAAMDFEVDGRTYVLQARRQALAAGSAQESAAQTRACVRAELGQRRHSRRARACERPELRARPDRRDPLGEPGGDRPRRRLPRPPVHLGRRTRRHPARA